MEITPTTIIIVGVVCVVLGFLASMLLNTLSDNNETPPAVVDDAPPGGRKGQYTPIARLWRLRSAGTLIVEMEGKAMVSPSSLNEVQREMLEQSARDLRAWLGMGLAASEPAVAGNEPEVDLNRVIAPVVVKEALPPVPKTDAPAQQAAPVSAARPISAVPASARPAPVPPPAQKQKDESAPAPASKSIVMQIEDILQDMIAGTPLAQRSIHLTEDPSRGVIVQIGLEHYDGIESVPDLEVKRVIQSAVQKWENSQ